METTTPTLTTTGSDEVPPQPVDAAPPTDRARWAALWSATALMLLMVTKGPVFRLRLEVAGFSGDFIDDAWVQAAFLVGAGLVIVAALASGARPVATLRTDPVLLVALGGFNGLVVVSAVWSVNPERTLEQGAMMAVGAAAALTAGAALDRLGIVTALCAATQLGVAASVFAWWREWPLVLDRNGDLAGVYFNRNSLGPVALTAAVTAGVLAIVALRRGRNLLAGGLVAVAIVDVWVWWASGSLTPLFGLAVAAIGVGLFRLVLPGPGVETRRRAAAVVGAVAAVGALVAVVGRGAIATRLDRSPTLSGRTEIWDVVLQYVGDRPVLGHGFLAAWTRPGIVESLGEQYGREVYEAHSGFMEVLLGTGIVGLLVLLAALGLVLHRVATAAWRAPDALGLLLFGIAVYAVAVNLGETYVGANLLPWTLLMVVAGRAVAERAVPLGASA